MVKNFKNERVNFVYKEGKETDDETIRDVDSVVFFADRNVHVYSKKAKHGKEEILKLAKEWLIKKIKKNVVFREMEDNEGKEDAEVD